MLYWWENGYYGHSNDNYYEKEDKINAYVCKYVASNIGDSGFGEYRSYPSIHEYNFNLFVTNEMIKKANDDEIRMIVDSINYTPPVIGFDDEYIDGLELGKKKYGS